MYFMKRVFGRYGAENMPYLTRFKLFPMTPWGQPYLHIFHRGDYDRAFHDHPYDFWTFPLRTYYEDVLNLVTGRITRNAVTAWRWHFRPAEYTHIQMGSAKKNDESYLWRVHNRFNGPTITFLWRKKTRRAWGFWRLAHTTVPEGDELYIWTHHKEYENVA